MIKYDIMPLLGYTARWRYQIREQAVIKLLNI
jgi:hypothetical protein